MDEEKPPNPDDEAYVITGSLEGEEVEIPARWQTMASYELELPAKCPHCRAPIRTLNVVRLSRTKVAFTSTLPRSGRAMVCPECETIISVEAAGLI